MEIEKLRKANNMMWSPLVTKDEMFSAMRECGIEGAEEAIEDYQKENIGPAFFDFQRAVEVAYKSAFAPRAIRVA